MNDVISPIIKEQFPFFIREEYPKFARFLYDYFRSLEQDDGFLRVLADWTRNTEPSLNIDGYIDAILRDAGFEFQRPITIAKSTLLHLLREFFLSRGSERSFRFLFRVMFNVDVDIAYPRESMLWLDMADYGEKSLIFLRSTHIGDIRRDLILENVKSQGGTISGSISQTRAGIEDIRVMQGPIGEYLEVEIVLPESNFLPEDLITIDVGGVQINETIIPVIQFRIDNPGKGYRESDRLIVTGVEVSGYGHVSSTRRGSIDSVVVVQGGAGHEVGERIAADSSETGFGFTAEVSQVDAGVITHVRVTHGGYNYERIPTILSHDPLVTLEATSETIGQIQGFDITAPFLGAVAGVDVTIESTSGSGAVIAAVPTVVFSRSSWTNERGVLGENSTLIDSRRYQQFSYDVISSVSPGRYRDIVDDLLHPVGYVKTSIVDLQSHSVQSINPVGSQISTSIALEYPISYLEIRPSHSSITTLQYGDAILGTDGVNTYVITTHDMHVIVQS